MAGRGITVIGTDDEKRVFPLSISFEAFHQATDLIIVVGHALVVESLLGMGRLRAVDAVLFVGGGIAPSASEIQFGIRFFIPRADLRGNE